MDKKIIVIANGNTESQETKKLLMSKLDNVGFQVSEEYDENAELLVSIGGDGTFLQTVHGLDFPDMPIIGINTGHLGFFQEIMPDRLDDFIFNYTQGRYCIQQLDTICAKVRSKGKTYEHIGVNEVVICGDSTRSIHLNMSIEGSFIERFSGDGLLISSPAGSTAYNYSLGGSIVDPRLRLLQVTPIAPMNTIAYRSFTSSILLPSDMSLGIVPEFTDRPGKIKITFDGFHAEYDRIEDIQIGFSDISIKLLRFENYDFWTKVKSKFL